jgi:hypothetical protein
VPPAADAADDAAAAGGLGGAAAVAGLKRPRAELSAEDGDAAAAEPPPPPPLPAEVASLQFHEPPHDYLEDVEVLLRRVHAQYYASFDAAAAAAARGAPPPPAPHTSALLQAAQAAVLRGTCLVFSGVFPLHVDARRTPLHRRSLLFGACVADAVDEGDGEARSGGSPAATHVVARMAGTKKIADAAARSGVRVVGLPWLEESLRRYARQRETDYPLDEAHRALAEREGAAEREAAVRAFCDGAAAARGGGGGGGGVDDDDDDDDGSSAGGSALLHDSDFVQDDEE